MNIEQYKRAITAAHEIRQPLMGWGEPGVGKSAAHKQAADELGIELVDLRLPLLDPTDLRGLPTVSSNITKWIPPSFLPTKGKGILFLDELVQATTSMQAAASQLVLDFRIGDYVLPKGWSVHAAGNRAAHRAATNAMPTHLANRFVHIDVETDVQGWINYALQAKIDIRVIAFIKWRAQLLHQFDPKSKSLAWPSERSWHFVSNILQAKSLPVDLLATMIKGTVGEGPVAEFMGFLKVFDKLPNIDSIMLNPKTAAIPTDPATLYAVVTTLSQAASADNIGKLSAYFNRLTDEAGRPDFSILAMKEISARDKNNKIAQTRPWIEWAAKHSSMVI